MSLRSCASVCAEAEVGHTEVDELWEDNDDADDAALLDLERGVSHEDKEYPLWPLLDLERGGSVLIFTGGGGDDR